jgi:hypothetical protein
MPYQYATQLAKIAIPLVSTDARRSRTMNQSWYIRALSLLVCALAYGAGAAAEDGKAQPAPSAVAQGQEVLQKQEHYQQLQANQVGVPQVKSNVQDIAKIAEILGDMPGGYPAQLQTERAAQSMINELNIE